MRWRQFRLRGVVHLISRLPATASPHRGSLWRFQKSFKRLVDCTDLQLPISIFFCFSKRKRWRVRNDHDGTNPCKQGFLSSVLISSFPNRELNSRFGFFYANLQQPLSLGCAEPAPLEGEPRGCAPPELLTTSQSAALTASLPLLSLRDISP